VYCDSCVCGAGWNEVILYFACIILQILTLFYYSLLSAFIQPFPFLYAAFLLTHAGLGSLTSIVMTWASETISSNGEIRAMAIAAMNTSSSFMWVWTSLVLWPVTDAPYYRKAFFFVYILNHMFTNPSKK
jgi:ACS family pantothenate transporter-like MFS transporter